MNRMTEALIRRLEKRIAELEKEAKKHKELGESWQRWGRLQEIKRQQVEAKFGGEGVA